MKKFYFLIWDCRKTGEYENYEKGRTKRGDFIFKCGACKNNIDYLETTMCYSTGSYVHNTEQCKNFFVFKNL